MTGECIDSERNRTFFDDLTGSYVERLVLGAWSG